MRGFRWWIATAATAIASAHAVSVKVDSYAALQSAIDAAQPGDAITLANGAYTFGGKITITKKGTEAQPITISAETVGGAEIKGSGGFAFGSGAEWVTVGGFKFTHAAGTTSIAVGANHCRFTRNVFQLAGNGYQSYLSISGNDAQIDFNTFQHKNFVGQMITVQGPADNSMAQRTWIHHNYFFDFPNCGANNCSSIQVGLSSRSLHPAFSLVEHNLFVNTHGENENICNKSCDNTYRYNTFRDRSSELSLRHGDRQQVYGNFFINTDGLRIFGNEHRIYSNYFEKCTPAIHVGNGDGNVPPSDLKSHDRPDSVKVVFNTLVDNGTNVTMDGRGGGGLGCWKLTFSHNLIKGGNTALNFGGPNKEPTWNGNVVFGNSGGAGQLPAGAYTSVDPRLGPDNNGEQHLQAGSPLIGMGSDDFPWVTVDMDGQARRETYDVGADQFSSAPVANRILTTADVGPDAAPFNGTYIFDAPRPAHAAAIPRVFKSGGGAFALPGEYRGVRKSVAIHSLEGRLLRKTDLGTEGMRLELPEAARGIFLVKVTPLF
jgi:hypothetical protein